MPKYQFECYRYDSCANQFKDAMYNLKPNAHNPIVVDAPDVAHAYKKIFRSSIHAPSPEHYWKRLDNITDNNYNVITNLNLDQILTHIQYGRMYELVLKVTTLSTGKSIYFLHSQKRR